MHGSQYHDLLISWLAYSHGSLNKWSPKNKFLRDEKKRPPIILKESIPHHWTVTVRIVPSFACLSGGWAIQIICLTCDFPTSSLVWVMQLECLLLTNKENCTRQLENMAYWWTIQCYGVGLEILHHHHQVESMQHIAISHGSPDLSCRSQVNSKEHDTTGPRTMKVSVCPPKEATGCPSLGFCVSPSHKLPKDEIPGLKCTSSLESLLATLNTNCISGQVEFTNKYVTFNSKCTPNAFSSKKENY